MGEQPPANGLQENQLDALFAQKYPLDLLQCQKCSLLQLGYVVPRDKLYQNYPYVPSVSQTNLAHFDNIARLAVEKANLKGPQPINSEHGQMETPADLVVDIGCNDGSLLSYFKAKQLRTVGIEPARNIAALAWAKHQIPTFIDYFDPSVAQRVVDTHGPAKLVTATNVFAHVDKLDPFMEGLDRLVARDGVFFAQFPDARNLLRENQFDTIYHEHLSYFTYEPLYTLFNKSPFEIFDLTSDNIHGGSMQLWARRRDIPIQDFLKNVDTIKHQLRTHLLNEKEDGKKIAGFGAAAKGTVLLNACGLDSSIIDYVADGTPQKQGKFIPGVGIPIVPEEHLRENPPDSLLILAWNFKEEIMRKLSWSTFDFVIPVPNVRIHTNRKGQP